MREWRVAIMGLGHWYSAYNTARALRDYPGATLVAAASHDPQQLEAFTRTFGVRGYDSYERLLEHEDIDIVQTAAPVSELAELAILAAGAGKHLIIGKPMAMRVSEAERMTTAITAAGVACFPFQGIMRLRAAELKTRVDNGDIGDLVVMHQACRWSIAEDAFGSGTPGWFADPAQVPGGALIDEGIYWIDLFRWMAGSEVVLVEAKTANLVHKELAVEDWGMATFTFANGIIATLEASWTINAPRKTGPSPKQNSLVRLELVGTRGEIIDQYFRAPGRAVLAAGAADWVYERQSEQPYAPPAPFPLAHLIECLEQNRPPAASIEDARRSFVIAMAAYDSAREKRPISLTW
jgi:predicted dehydrogenase